MGMVGVMREGVEREVMKREGGKGGWLREVIANNQTNVQCEQIISTPYPPLHTHQHTHDNSFVTTDITERRYS